jgi:hypothetical protein
MQVNELYEVLCKLGRKWRLEDGAMRAPTSSKRVTQVCPITAVCYSQTGKLFEDTEYEQAAKLIGLRKRDATRIANAADGCGPKRVHEKLLRATGLK